MIYSRANPLQRFMRDFAATRPVSWLFARTLHHVDRPVFRLTKGRHTFASLVSGLPVVMLTTTGARSGKRRTVALLGLPVGEEMAVIASNYGKRHHPAWYLNLRANPEATLSLGGRERRVVAREAGNEERERLWTMGLEIYPGWAGYERRASGRRIPVMVLSRNGRTARSKG
jgi:deazaflavin-dependent oxidoreductase (nitroreductase family)